MIKRAIETEDDYIDRKYESSKQVLETFYKLIFIVLFGVILGKIFGYVILTFLN